MKIIQLLYTLASGGAEKFVVNLSNELESQGHDVIICMLREEEQSHLTFNKQFLAPNVEFYSMNFKSGISLKKVYLVEKYLKGQNPDIVHCHLNVTPYIFRMSISNEKIKFVHTIHNVASKASGVKSQYYLNKLFYKTKIQPITISRECDMSFVDYYHLTNSVCIENGCPKVTASNLLFDVSAEVESYKTHLDTPVFVHIARCSSQKNQQLLIDAFNVIDRNGIDYALLVIGNGYFEKQHKCLIDSACDKIHFLGEKKNVGDYLLCADAFCLSSVYEGLPISLIEAMSCGIPSICTSVGGIPDVVVEGVTGFLSKDMDTQSYVNAIMRFLENSIKSEIIIDMYERRFSIVECAKRYMSVYKSI